MTVSRLAANWISVVIVTSLFVILVLIDAMIRQKNSSAIPKINALRTAQRGRIRQFVRDAIKRIGVGRDAATRLSNANEALALLYAAISICGGPVVLQKLVTDINVGEIQRRAMKERQEAFDQLKG